MSEITELTAAVVAQTQAFADKANPVLAAAANIAAATATINRQLPPAASDPTTRPGGAPLEAGDYYFNTVANAVKVYNAGAWALVPGASAADLASTAPSKGDSLLGHARQATTVKSKLDNITLLENRTVLRDFYKSLFDYSVAPATTRFAIACYGDSVASHVWGGLVVQMYGNYQNGGVMGPGAGNGLAGTIVTTTGSVVDGNALPVDQSVYDGTGGKADFTYLPSADHVTLSSGATITVDLGQQTGFSEGRVYLATGPGMGSAFVELLNEANTVLQSMTINLSAGSVGATKAQFSALPKNQKYKLRTTATGKVVHLRSVFLRDHGLVPFNLQRGGSTLAQNNYSNTAILSYLLTDLKVSLIVCQCKEENAAVNVPATMTRFNSISASKLIVGSLPDSGPEAGQLANNVIFRNNALANGCAYFDGYYAFGSYAELVRLGWQGDGTHPDAGANNFVAAQILSELGPQFFTGSKEGREVDLTVSEFPVTAGRYRVPAGDGSGTPIELIVPYGGAAPSLGMLKNVGRVAFGPESPGTSCVAGYGSDQIGVFDFAGNFIGFRSRYIVTSDATVQNTFAGGLNVDACVLSPPAYTVAALPGTPGAPAVASRPGSVVFASNGRKIGEGVGVGSGVWVYLSAGSSQWRRFSDDTVVVA